MFLIYYSCAYFTGAFGTFWITFFVSVPMQIISNLLAYCYVGASNSAYAFVSYEIAFRLDYRSGFFLS